MARIEVEAALTRTDYMLSPREINRSLIIHRYMLYDIAIKEVWSDDQV